MRFEIGDIVSFQRNSPIYSIIPNKSSFGIISNKARLMYVCDWESTEVLREFWAYDIIIEGRVFVNVSEEGLKGLLT